MHRQHRIVLLTAALLLGRFPAPAATNAHWFKIVSLTTNNAVFADAPLAGSLAASADHLFASRVGDSEFRRWEAQGLANPATLSPGFIVVSDLRTEKVYAFADASGTMTDRGTATALHELDPATGQTNGVVITLSAGVPVEDTCSPEYGIFCGWGRVVVGSRRLRDIALPSGQVTLMPSGMGNPFDQFCDPSEPLTGIAEFFGDELYLVACQPFNGEKIQRVRLANGARTTVASFPGLPSKTKLTFSPSRQRWYFSTETSWLNNHPLNEGAVGYADATWDQSDEFPPPPKLTVTLPALITLTEETTTNAFGSFTQRENADTTRIRVVESSDPSLLPTNRITFFGGGNLFGESGAFEFVVNPLPNRDGLAVLTFLTTNNVGDRATNFVTVNVTGVNDAPAGTWTQSSITTNAQALAVTITNTLRLIDPDTPGSNLLVRVFSSNPLLVPPTNLTLLPGDTNRPVLVTLTPNLAGRVDVFAEIVDPVDGSVARSASFSITADGGQPLRHFNTVPGTDFAVFGLGGLRGFGAGTLSVTGLVGSVKQALLFWHEQTQTDPLAPLLNVPPMFNGAALGGFFPAVPVEALRVSGSNCWGKFQAGVAYRADVTSLVPGNGDYLLSNFTTNACRFLFQNTDCATRDASGASLLVFYDDGDPANDRDVMIFEGNDANEPSRYDAVGWSNRLAGIRYTGGLAQLGLHVSDGQSTTDGTNYLDGTLRLNGVTLIPAGTNFEGNTTPRSVGGTTNGSLWDIRTEDITSLLTPGTNALDLTFSLGNDCLSLVVATVNLPAGSALPVADLSIRQHVITATATNPPTAVVSNNPIVTFTFTVTNASGFAAEGVRVTNLFETGVTVDASSVSQGALSILSDAVVADLGTLNPGAIATITLTLRYPRVGYFANQAWVSADTLDLRADANPSTGQFVSKEVQVLSISTAPRPKLAIHRAGAGQYEISWTPATPGFTLQSTDSLSPTNWVNAPSGAANPVTVPATPPARFYRLFKP